MIVALRFQLIRFSTSFSARMFLIVSTVASAVVGWWVATGMRSVSDVGVMASAVIGGERTFFLTIPAVCAAIVVVLCGDQYLGATGAQVFAVLPRRGRVVAAFAVAASVYALLLALFGAAVTWSAWWLTGDTGLSSARHSLLIGALIWYGAAACAAALTGVGCVVLLRRRIAALACALVLAVVIEPMITRLLSGAGLPSLISSAISATLRADMADHVRHAMDTAIGRVVNWSPPSAVVPHSLVGGLEALAAIAATMLCVGAIALRRRDIRP